MFRLLPLIALAGCLLPEDDEPEEPAPICGDGVEGYGEQCDDGNSADGDSCSSTCDRVEHYTVHWRTSSVSGAMHSCPAGFDLATVIVQRPNGSEIELTTPCADGAERIQIPLLYSSEPSSVAVVFASSSTGEVYGETLSAVLREVTDLVMYEDQGFVHVAWTFHSATWGDLDCFNANVPDVTINVAHDGWRAATATVPCMQLALYSPPVVHGVYDVELVTSQGSTMIRGVAIDDRSALTELGNVTIPVP